MLSFIIENNLKCDRCTVTWERISKHMCTASQFLLRQALYHWWLHPWLCFPTGITQLSLIYVCLASTQHCIPPSASFIQCLGIVLTLCSG